MGTSRGNQPNLAADGRAGRLFVPIAVTLVCLAVTAANPSLHRPVMDVLSVYWVGSAMPTPAVIAVLPDGEEWTVNPDEMGLRPREFLRMVVPAVRDGRMGALRKYAEVYEHRTGRRVVAMRLRDDPALVNRAHRASASRMAATRWLNGIPPAD